MRHLGSLCLALLATAAGAAVEPADLVLHGGHVVTVDRERPEAQAVAVQAGRIVAVGSDAEIAARIGARTEVVELQGRLLIPAFIEGHGHFLGLGASQRQLDLTRVSGWDEIVAMVRTAVAKARPGEWIRGRGWHQEKWTKVPEPNVEGVPLHAALSAVSPENPVLLSHASGHAVFVNARTLALAGIDRTTANPPGGEIVRDANGAATGLLKETAEDLATAAWQRAEVARTPAEREAETVRQIELAGAAALAHGVTTFHDAGVSFATLDLYRRLAAAGKLPLRIYALLGASFEELAAKAQGARLIGGSDGFVTARAIKLYADGALGSHGAWLLAPYADLPTSTGLPTTPTAELAATIELALKSGFQVGIHAIGDRANREVLDLYAAALARHPEVKDARLRIEHAQHLDPADVPRFARLGVVAAMQGVHCTSDGPWVPKRLGAERAQRTSYLWRSLLDSGAVVANGTDVPVEPIDPIANFAASVTRRMANGEAFFPEQRMTRAEALHSLTLANAWAGFEEAEKGSITPGKRADLAVLSGDLMRLPEPELPSVRVDLTVLAGRVVYRRQGEGR